MEFMPEHAPAVALAFLTICFGLLAGAFVRVHASLTGRRRRAGQIGVAMVAAAGIYSGILLAFSLSNLGMRTARSIRRYSFGYSLSPNTNGSGESGGTV